MPNETMMKLAREMIGENPEQREQQAFLSQVADKQHFYKYIFSSMCKIPVAEVKRWNLGDAEKIVEEAMMSLERRLENRDQDQQYDAAAHKELEIRIQKMDADLSDMEKSLSVKVKELENVRKSVAAKEQIRVKLSENVRDLSKKVQELERENADLKRQKAQEPKKSEKPRESLPQPEKGGKMPFLSRIGKKKKVQDEEHQKFRDDELAQFSFRTEVLKNKRFSREQKDFLFSLIESGESYVNVRLIADPDIAVEDMERFYKLAFKGGVGK